MYKFPVLPVSRCNWGGLICLCLFCCLFVLPAVGQVFPREGSLLNYRIIGFSFPKKQHVVKYEIEVAQGSFVDTASFRANRISSFISATNKIIGEVPDFGVEYTWRITAAMAGGATFRDTVLHRFRIGSVPEIDPKMNRIKVVQPALKYKDACFFADYNRALYDMKGNPVWYMPVIDNVTSAPRDIKLSPAGTITMMQEENGAYEINYNGGILWRSPHNGTVSGDSTEHCHHDFTRLKNGHYVMLGKEYVRWPLPAGIDSARVCEPGGSMAPDTDGIYRQLIEFGTVIEYDSRGNVVWSWKSAAYFRHSDLYARRTATGAFDLDNVHENALYFDEAANMVYVSFRNLSRIVKISRATGAVVNEYGDTYLPGKDVAAYHLFCFQHCCRRSQKGLLYLFDNNQCNFPDFPKLLMMREPPAGSKALQTVWEYNCAHVTNAPFAVDTKFKSIGSSVSELPDHSLLSCMNFFNTTLFIVGMDKKILWSALSEKWDNYKKDWVPNYQYRASLVTRKQLEQLIWDSEAGIK